MSNEISDWGKVTDEQDELIHAIVDQAHTQLWKYLSEYGITINHPSFSIGLDLAKFIQKDVTTSITWTLELQPARYASETEEIPIEDLLD